MPFRLAFLTALTVSLFPAVSHSAMIITLNFAGEVNQVYDPHGIVGPQIALGAPVTVSLRYNTEWPDLYPNDPTRGSYGHIPGWFKVNIDGLLFEQVGSHQVDVLTLGFEGRQGAEFQALGENPTAWPATLPQFDVSLIFLRFAENQPPFDLLSSDAPPASLDLTRADPATGTAGSSTHDETMYLIQFALTQQLPGEVIIVPEPEPTPVPEPGTLSLLALGCATVGLRRLLR